MNVLQLPIFNFFFFLLDAYYYLYFCLFVFCVIDFDQSHCFLACLVLIFFNFATLIIVFCFVFLYTYYAFFIQRRIFFVFCYLFHSFFFFSFFFRTIISINFCMRKTFPISLHGIIFCYKILIRTIYYQSIEYGLRRFLFLSTFENNTFLIIRIIFFTYNFFILNYIILL